MQQEEIIILVTDEESAKKVTVEAWMSSKGNYFLSEDSARQDGATHTLCKCGQMFKRDYYTACVICRDEAWNKKNIEQYNKKEFKEWDEKTPLYSYAHDEYFYSIDDIECFLEDNELGPTPDLRLVICEGVKPGSVDADYFEQALPENYDFDDVASKAVKNALNALNEALAQEKPWSWEPGKYRTTINIEADNK